MTFYLKYRSQTLEELDLEEVRESLKKIVSSGKIPHALIFSGPKGTGKTSAARILAKIVNCENPQKTGEPCNKCEQCISIAKGENLDVVEIDAASHRGIDDVRALREAVKLAPVKSRHKVYIIDEAHMLTTEASNALLKTLEEPPEHVMFILATTNPEKLLETIRSRATNITFRKGKLNEIVRSLERVVKGEQLKTSKEALEFIAKVSGGSFRDATKILEQLVSEGKKLEKAEVEDFLFGRREFNVDEFLEILSKGNARQALEVIENVVEKGVPVKNITTLLLERLHEALMAKAGMQAQDISYLTKADIVKLIKSINETQGRISTSLLEQIPLEVFVVEWCEKKLKNPLRATDPQGWETKFKKGDYENKNKDNGRPSGRLDRKESEDTEAKDFSKESGTSLNGMSDELWNQVLAAIRPRNASTEALLRASKPVAFDGRILKLGVYYKFHKEHLEANPHRDILEAVLQEVLQSPIRVICSLTEHPLKKTEVGDSETKKEDVVLTEGEDEDIIKVAKEIFGS